jgi:hypothetical protein
MIERFGEQYEITKAPTMSTYMFDLYLTDKKQVKNSYFVGMGR